MESNPNAKPVFSARDDAESSASVHADTIGRSVCEDLGEAVHQVREDVEQARDSVVDAAEVLRNAAVDCATDIAAVVRDLVRERYLKESERAAKLKALDAALARGIADAEAGRSMPVDEAFRRLRAELKLSEESAE